MKWQKTLIRIRNFLYPPDSELGPDFLEEIRLGALRGLRIACWMALVAGFTFTAVYVLRLSQSFWRLLPSLLGTMLLGPAGVLGSYTRLGQKYPRGLSVILAAAIGSLLVVNQLEMRSHTYGHFSGHATILMVMAALGTLQPFWVLLCGLYFLCLYAVLGLWLDPTVGWPPALTFVLPYASLAVSVVISVWLAAALHRGRRTQFLLRKQLAQAFRELQETEAQLLASEKALTQSQVVAALSHDLNNPLGVVVSNLSTQDNLAHRLRAKCSADSESSREIEKLLSAHQELNRSSLTAAQRMNKLLERLREFSHLDRSATQSIDLNAELLKALEMVKAETQVVVQVDTHLNPLPELLCQPQKLGMAFANLLRNAFQAVGENGVIRVSTDHFNEHISNHHVEVLIEDNGRGIDPAELKTIFDPKFVPQSGKIRISWGLAISQQILLQHGGQLFLESTLGKGTIAKVRLPLREQVELNPKASAARSLSGYNPKVSP